MSAITNPPSPHVLPLGEAQPPNQQHSVSVSMPTWDSVTGWGNREDRVVNQLQTIYPRFFIHAVLQKLTTAVRERLGVTEDLGCMLFPTHKTAERFISALRAEDAEKTVDSAKFHIAGAVDKEEELWGNFWAVFYHLDLAKPAFKQWVIVADGLSSRHGEFCLDRFDFMASESTNTYLRSSAPSTDSTRRPPVPWTDSAIAEKERMRKLIAKLATSEKPGAPPVSIDDVFLYPRGMIAIGEVARTMLATLPDDSYSGAVVYGFPYAETPKAAEMVGFQRFTLYGRGVAEELDELEALLEAGQRIRVLFCEIPCNPLLESVDMGRLRALADKYDFIVVCDETLGTWVNVDLFPCVDLVMTSLTKIFSGASNVMGGSVVINPQSRHHDAIRTALLAQFEDAFFPLDATVLAQNSADVEERIKRCNNNALAIANVLALHPSIDHVKYPTMVRSAPLYEKCRRREGGYGYLLSIIFRRPQSAVCFYDALDVCKGPSVGTNFTLAIPYAQLAHFHELDHAEEHGIVRHIVRISVGLEDEKELLDRIRQALFEVEKLEQVSLLPPVDEATEKVVATVQTAPMVS